MVSPHIFVGPVIALGAKGAFPYTVSEILPKLPHALTAVTEILPETKVERTLTFIGRYQPVAYVIGS